MALPLLPVASNDEEDVRPVKPDWAKLLHLVEGLRQAAHPDHIEYLQSAVALAYREGFAAGRRAPPRCGLLLGCFCEKAHMHERPCTTKGPADVR